jgi:hypothetical protein
MVRNDAATRGSSLRRSHTHLAIGAGAHFAMGILSWRKFCTFYNLSPGGITDERTNQTNQDKRVFFMLVPGPTSLIMLRMGITEDFMRLKHKADPPAEEHLSGFELNVRRLEGVMLLCQGDVDKVMEIVTGWVKEAKKRYDAKY